MAKASGLGGNLYLNGYDLSGDVGMVSSIRDSQSLLDVTGIDKSAIERIPGLGDGAISFTAFFNDAALGEHAALSGRGSGDKIVTYAVDTTIGKAGWALVGKQVDYAGSRGADGSFALTVDVQTSDGEGNRGGEMLTAGKRTDTGATTGTTVNSLAATALGACLYLHVFSFAGTDATVKIEDSANGSAWTDLASASFTAITSAPTSQRIALAAGATVRQYLRATTTTATSFTSLVFAVIACRR